MTHATVLDSQSIERIATDFRRDGVVQVQSLFSAAEVTELRHELQRYIREDLPHRPTDACTFEADGKTVRNLWRLEQHHPEFSHRVDRDDVRKLVRPLVQGEPVLVAVETFNKPARLGSAVPWHQDNAYFCRTPPDMLTIWVALDRVTLENGPVYYIPGSHHSMLPSRPSGVTGNSMGLAVEPDTPVADQFCGLLDPGDALIHHCQVLHRSAPNLSEHPRMGLLLVYRGMHTETDTELKQAYDQANSQSL